MDTGAIQGGRQGMARLQEDLPTGPLKHPEFAGYPFECQKDIGFFPRLGETSASESVVLFFLLKVVVVIIGVASGVTHARTHTHTHMCVCVSVRVTGPDVC